MLAQNRYWRLVSTNRDFRRLYAAQLVSFGGDWFLTVPLLGLVWDLTRSKLAVSGVMAAQMLPIFLLSPLAGQAADRFDRKRLMVASDIVRAALCVALLLVDDLGSPGLAFLLVAGIGVGTAFFFPNPSAALPNLVAKEDLQTANVLLGSAWGTMAAIGAAAGGIFASAVGRDAAFLVDGASFIASAVLLAGIKKRFSEVRAGRVPGFVESARETIRYAREHPEVGALLTSKAGFGITSGAIILLSVLSADVFHTGDAGTGWLFAARGLGALVGPFLVRRMVGEDDRRLMNAIGLTIAAWGVCYVGLGVAPSLRTAVPIVVIAHLGGGAQWMLSSYGLQRATPDAIRGRIFAFDFGLVTLTGGLSFFLAGALAEPFGVRAVIIGAGAAGTLFGLAWGRATRRFWDAPAFRREVG